MPWFKKSTSKVINTPQGSFEVSTLKGSKSGTSSSVKNGHRYSTSTIGGPLVEGRTLVDTAPVPKKSTDFDAETNSLMSKSNRTPAEEARLARLVGSVFQSTGGKKRRSTRRRKRSTRKK